MQQATQSPSVTYKKQVSSSPCQPQHQPVLVPRNSKQISNMQSLQKQKIRLSQDVLYNLHESTYDIPDFVHKIVTYISESYCYRIKDVLNKCNRILGLWLSSPNSCPTDAPFQMGDFYVSSLLFWNILFRNSSVMPAMFAIHEKDIKSHSWWDNENCFPAVTQPLHWSCEITHGYRWWIRIHFSCWWSPFQMLKWLLCRTMLSIQLKCG